MESQALVADKAQVNVFPSSPAVQKEPGFPLVGVETDTPFLTDPASSLEAPRAHLCQQIHVGGESPICQVFCLGMHMFISLIMAKIPKHRHKGKHKRTHN